MDRFASEAIDAVERNEPIVVLPSRARLVWRIGRFFPGLIFSKVAAIARRERAAPTA